MKRPRVTAAMASAFAILAASAMTGSALSAGAAEPTEGPGNNLTVPLIFSEGVGLTGAQLPADTSTATIDTTGIRGAPYPAVNLVDPSYLTADPTPYYKQNTANEWQAQWANGQGQTDPVGVQADWGDNIVRHTWNGESQVRVEVGLTLNDPLATPMVGYQMKSLSGSQSNEVQGAVGVADSDPRALLTNDFSNPSVYSAMARLTIDKIDTVNGTAMGTGHLFDGAVWQAFGSTDGEGSGGSGDSGGGGSGFAAEVNGGGKVLYGYNWNLKNLDLTKIGLPSRPKSGWYRLTFSLDPSATVGETTIQRHSLIASLNPLDLAEETTEDEEGGGGSSGGGGGGGGGESAAPLAPLAAVDEGSGGGGGSGTGGTETTQYYKPALAADGYSTSLDVNILSSHGTTTDTTPPVATASAPQSVSTTAIPVSVTAMDNASLLYVDLYAKGPKDASFTVVHRFSPNGEQTTLAGTYNYVATQGDGRYEFSTRAADYAGNLEALPLVAEATTVLSTYVTPPGGGGGTPGDTGTSPSPTPSVTSPAPGGGGGQSSPQPGQASPTTCGTITVVAPKSIVAGAPARVVLRGPAGAKIQLLAYSQPSMTYRMVRTGTLDGSGMTTFDVWPQTNTRMFARQAQCSNGPSTVLLVQPRLTMTIQRLHLRTYAFSGSAPALVPGTLVSLYRYGPNGLLILTAQTRVTEQHTWRVTRTFLGSGSFRFVARTGANMFHAAGAGPVQFLSIR